MRKSLSLAAMAVAAVVVVALTITLVPSGKEGPGTPDRVFPALEPLVNDVDTIEIQGSEDTVRVQRDASGWVVPGRHDHPADEARVRGLVLAMAQAKVVEYKTGNPELYAALGVSDPTEPDSRAVAVTLMNGDGDVIASLLVGDAGRGEERFVRVKDAARSMLASPVPRVEASIRGWLDREILSLARADIESIEVRRGDGDAVLLETGDDGKLALANLPEGTKLRYQFALDDFASTFADLELEDVRPAAGHAFDGEFEASITTGDGLVIEMASEPIDDVTWLRFTARAEEGADAAVVSRAESLNDRWRQWAYRLSETAMSRLTKPMSELVEDLEPAQGDVESAPQGD